MEVLLKRWIVRDSERWTVAEMDARHVPGARGNCCLICESDLSVRRLWSYPADWHRMEDGKLLALFAAPLVRNMPARPAAGDDAGAVIREGMRTAGIEVAVER
jgi:hypothetical protein